MFLARDFYENPHYGRKLNGFAVKKMVKSEDGCLLGCCAV
jgi:hypothetical protein